MANIWSSVNPALWEMRRTRRASKAHVEPVLKRYGFTFCRWHVEWWVVALSYTDGRDTVELSAESEFEWSVLAMVWRGRNELSGGVGPPRRIGESPQREPFAFTSLEETMRQLAGDIERYLKENQYRERDDGRRRFE